MWEWTESAFDGISDLSSESRGIRGGYWESTEIFLSSSFRLTGTPAGEIGVVGFRVASSVPEPSAALLVLISGGALLLKRRPKSSL